MPMKHPLPLLVALMTLSACDTGVSYFHRTGVSVSRMQTETTKCEVEALKDAPVANQIRQDPPIYFPSYGYGGLGYWAPGRVYSVDVNADLRNRVMDMCMAQRGYQPVHLPNCPDSVRAATPPRQTTTLPQLTPQSCVIRYGEGQFQIVNTAPAPG